MSDRRFLTPLTLALLIAVVLLGGCRRGASRAVVEEPRQSRFGPRGVDRATHTVYALDSDTINLTDTHESLYVFNGRTAEPLTGRQVLSMLRSADVVILGEMHTDPMAHRLQERFVREALAAGGGALSLEMMSRDEQASLDRVRGRPARAEQTLTDTSLADWPHWTVFYLPAIEAALQMGRPVVAANAPRELVRSARLYGYDYMRDLPRDRQRLFDLPGQRDRFPEYEQRVRAAAVAHVPATRPAGAGDPTTRPATRPQRERMNAHLPAQEAEPASAQQGRRQGAATQPATRPSRGPSTQPSAQQPRGASTRPATRPTYPPRDPMSPDAFYEAQLVWDATMAQSIMNARRRYGTPVVHLVGSGHSDFDGGLTQMLRLRGADVVTVSFIPAESERLRPEDEGRADIVIYTGADRPIPAPRAGETPPAPRPVTRPVQRTPTTRPATTRPAGQAPATQPASGRPRPN